MHSDRNCKEIVDALRAAGCVVVRLDPARDRHSKGLPDLLVGCRGATWLLEVKDGKNDLNANQIEWHNSWTGGPLRIVRSPEEALAMVGLT